MRITNERLQEIVNNLTKNSMDVLLAATELGIKPISVTRYYREACSRGICSKSEMVDLLEANVNLGKRLQKAADINRIERKGFRNAARVENSIEAFGENIDLLLNKHAGKIAERVVKSENPNKPEDMIGVVQITDSHFNELVDLPHNKYDFTVASKRLKKLVIEAKHQFLSKGINKVVLAITGDLLNSDRRLDELLSQANNRAKAAILAMDLLKYVICDLASDFDVDVVSVLGNESRNDQEMTYGDHSLSNNYDFTILAMLERLLSEVKHVNFISYSTVEFTLRLKGNDWEQVLHISHDFSGQSNKQKDTQATIGRMSIQQKVNVDYILAGHIHATHNGDLVSRSSSLVGANAYSDKKLNLASRAAQNLYIFGKDTRLVIAVDLQNASNDGYPIEKELEAYNSKSVSKTEKQKTVLQIVTTI